MDQQSAVWNPVGSVLINLWGLTNAHAHQRPRTQDLGPWTQDPGRMQQTAAAAAAVGSDDGTHSAVKTASV